MIRTLAPGGTAPRSKETELRMRQGLAQAIRGRVRDLFGLAEQGDNAMPQVIEC